MLAPIRWVSLCIAPVIDCNFDTFLDSSLSSIFGVFSLVCVVSPVADTSKLLLYLFWDAPSKPKSSLFDFKVPIYVEVFKEEWGLETSCCPIPFLSRRFFPCLWIGRWFRKISTCWVSQRLHLISCIKWKIKAVYAMYDVEWLSQPCIVDIRVALFPRIVTDFCSIIPCSPTLLHSLCPIINSFQSSHFWKRFLVHLVIVYRAEEVVVGSSLFRNDIDISLHIAIEVNHPSELQI